MILNRNKHITYLCILGILGFLVFCKGTNGSAETSVSDSKTITSNSQPRVRMKHLPEEKCWIVDHSVTYWTILGGPNKGKVMRFPVYNGKGPEIDEEELYSNIPRPESGPRIAQRYCVVVPAGEVEKTVRDIMDFYSKNILKDTDILRSFGDDTCDPKVQSSCEIFTGNIYAFGPEGFTIDGFDGTYTFGIYFPSIPGKNITVRNVWDIPIAETGGWEDETNRKNRKDAIIKWHLR